MNTQNIMYTLFQIKETEIKNRIVKSAMYEFGADNGQITQQIMDLYELAAKGGAGLIHLRLQIYRFQMNFLIMKQHMTN